MIMRLVAYGLSNKEIARQLNVPPGTIKADLDRIFRKFQINNRTELAALALSRLSGGIGALAALIFAALDDVHAAHPNAVGHTFTDTFTVMAPDGTPEVVTIVVNPKKSAGGSSATARTMIKTGRAENSAAARTTSTGKLVDSSVDIAGGTIPLAALNFARPNSGSYGAFMVAASVLIYELDTLCGAAQAFDLGDNLTDVFASAPENGTKELAAPTSPSSADANLGGFDNLAWLNPGIYDRSFAFETYPSDAIALDGDASRIVGSAASEESTSRPGKDSSLHAKSDDASDRSEAIHEGSATVNVLSGDTIDHGGFGEAATDASQHVKQTPGAGDDSNRGQSQRDLHASENGSAAAKQHAKHDATGDVSNHGQSQRGLHASESGSAAAEQHANVTDPGQSQRDLHTAHANASNDAHEESSQNGRGKDRASIDDGGNAETAAASELGDSFHFRNEMAASKASDTLEGHVRHEPDSITLSQHPAGHDGPAPIPDAALIAISLAEQNAVDSARGAEQHFTHDLIL